MVLLLRSLFQPVKHMLDSEIEARLDAFGFTTDEARAHCRKSVQGSQPADEQYRLLSPNGSRAAIPTKNL